MSENDELGTLKKREFRISLSFRWKPVGFVEGENIPTWSHLAKLKVIWTKSFVF
jgi:hypothetical protein